MVRFIRLVGALGVVAVLAPTALLADTLTSTNYQLDADVANTFGGRSGSTNYNLVDSGGETAVGAGASGSYKLTSGYVSQLQKSIQLNVLPNGVGAYYSLDTNTGTRIYDNTTNLNDGQMINSPVWSTGQIGNALTFATASSRRVDIPHSASIAPTSAMTVEAWVKPASTPGSSTNYQLVTKGSYGAMTGYRFYSAGYGAAGSLQFEVGDGSQRLTVSSGSTKLNNFSHWYHVVATYGSGTAKVYIDGNQVGSASLSLSSIASTGGILSIGSGSGGGEYFDGSIDEVKIYNRALSADEVANNYAAQSAGIVSAQTLPAVTPGVSQNTTTDMIVRTDAAGYDLAISQNHNLLNTDATTTIPGITSTIASTGLWNEGSTKGLGFSVVGGTSIEPAWGTSPNYKYAQLPSTSTSFHGQGGFTGGAPSITTVQFRLDTATNQKSGDYGNTVTLTATLRP